MVPADDPAIAAPATSPGPWVRWHISVAEAGDEPLCIALANTRARPGGGAVDGLARIDDLVRFACEHGLCDGAAAAGLAHAAGAHPRAAAAELAATRAVRDAIARVLPDPAHAAAADLALLARTFDAAHRSVRLELARGALAPRPRGADGGLESVRLQAAVSATVLLGSPRAERVRHCADARGCGRLFIDTTRNASRRYCHPGECGNRARQAAFRARHRKDPPHA